MTPVTHLLHIIFQSEYLDGEYLANTFYTEKFTEFSIRSSVANPICVRLRENILDNT